LTAAAVPTGCAKTVLFRLGKKKIVESSADAIRMALS
jgi:hypothetical protein